MLFTVSVNPGSSMIRRVKLYAASQINALPSQPNDFEAVTLSPLSSNTFIGSIPVGAVLPSGPAITPDNILYFAQVEDSAGYTVSSRMNYKTGPLEFCSGFAPVLDHFPFDGFTVQPPPAANCTCP
jgi:hypothetical protein